MKEGGRCNEAGHVTGLLKARSWGAAHEVLHTVLVQERRQDATHSAVAGQETGCCTQCWCRTGDRALHTLQVWTGVGVLHTVLVENRRQGWCRTGDGALQVALVQDRRQGTAHSAGAEQETGYCTH